MDDLLELDVAIPEMADLLSEVCFLFRIIAMMMYIVNYVLVLSIQVFTGGQEICLKIKEQQVEQVFLLIAYGGDVGRAELLGMLQSVVKVNIVNYAFRKLALY